MSAAEIRGRQTSVGEVAFIMPTDPPVTDDQVIEVEGLIERIENQLAPLRDMLKHGEGIKRALRNDINKCMRRRREEGNAPPLPLFDDLEDEGDGDPPAAAKKPAGKKRKAS